MNSEIIVEHEKNFYKNRNHKNNKRQKAFQRLLDAGKKTIEENTVKEIICKLEEKQVLERYQQTRNLLERESVKRNSIRERKLYQKLFDYTAKILFEDYWLNDSKWVIFISVKLKYLDN